MTDIWTWILYLFTPSHQLQHERHEDLTEDKLTSQVISAIKVFTQQSIIIVTKRINAIILIQLCTRCKTSIFYMSNTIANFKICKFIFVVVHQLIGLLLSPDSWVSIIQNCSSSSSNPIIPNMIDTIIRMLAHSAEAEVLKCNGTSVLTCFLFLFVGNSKHVNMIYRTFQFMQLTLL